MGSRLMALAAILVALTSIEVEACTGEPCNIGNPNMCRLVRETDRTGTMPTHRSLLGEPMPAVHRRLAATSSRRRLVKDKKKTKKTKKYIGKNNKKYYTQAEADDSYYNKTTSGSGKTPKKPKKPGLSDKPSFSGSAIAYGGYAPAYTRGGSVGWISDATGESGSCETYSGK